MKLIANDEMDMPYRSQSVFVWRCGLARYIC